MNRLGNSFLVYGDSVEDANDRHIRRECLDDCYFLCLVCSYGEASRVRLVDGSIIFDKRCPRCGGRMHLWKTGVCFVSRDHPIGVRGLSKNLLDVE